MYSSLDRADIVARHPKTQAEFAVQTDHREPAEIEAEPEVSIIFALTRVLNARVVRGEDAPLEVVYSCAAPSAPALLLEAVAAAGGTVECIQGGERVTVAWSGPEPRTPSELIDGAFAALAARVAAREGLPIDEALLAALEDEVLADPPTGEEQEIERWTAVAELAAVTGEILRRQSGGAWAWSAHAGTIPFAFDSTSNGSYMVADKADRFVTRGEHHRPSTLLRIAEDRAGDDSGRTMFNFKPHDWGMLGEAASRPLLESAPKTPWLVFGEDLPHTFATKLLKPGETADLPALERAAMERLREVKVTVEEMPVQELRLLVVQGDYFASEKIVDDAFMRSLEKRVGSELLAAAVPSKALLLVTSAIVPPETMAKFMAIALGRYGDADQPLSPTVFLLQDGRVTGFVGAGGDVAATSSTPPPRKKGFFSRIFGRN